MTADGDERRPEERPGSTTRTPTETSLVTVTVTVAVAATVRNIAEGANRLHPRDQVARFTVARGECGECEAALEMAQVLRLAPAAKLIELRRLADRVAAMLWGLVRRLRE